jgi:hypothetical protein
MSRIFSRKSAKRFFSQRLLAPLLFQERQGEVINMFVFIPFIFLARNAKNKPNGRPEFYE